MDSNLETNISKLENSLKSEIANIKIDMLKWIFLFMMWETVFILIVLVLAKKY